MATDDRQVLIAGQASAPANFKIPGNGQIRPKAVFASFDGTGAGSAFLPALKVISDAGETVGIYPTDTTVAAGASADVSWFPGGGLGGAGSVVNAGVVYSRGWMDQNFGDPGIIVPANGSIRAPMSHIDADATNTITWGQTVNPDDTATLQGPGLFIVQTSTHFQTGGVGEVAFVLVNTGEWPTMSWGNKSSLDSPAFTTDPLGLPTNLDYALVHVPAASTRDVSLMLEQNTAFNTNVTQAYMSIFGFPGV